MFSPADWNKLLAPEMHWKRAYPLVERAVREFLTDRWEDMGTADLVEALYPVAQARGDAGMAARKRLIKALLTLAQHGLCDCASKGPHKHRYGKDVKPWRWHASTTPKVHEPEVCPCCKRPL